LFVLIYHSILTNSCMCK